MTVIALTLSALLVVLGAIGLASPQTLFDILRRLQTPAGLYLAATIRLVLGISLVLVASRSRAPELVRIIGFVVIFAGLVTPFFGLERYRKLLDWWLTRSRSFVSVWAILAVAFGLLLIYLVFP